MLTDFSPYLIKPKFHFHLKHYILSPQFTVHSSQSTVHSQQFTVNNSQSTVHSQQFTVNNWQAASG